MSYISNTKISGMSVQQLSKALQSGELTETRLRQAYSDLRRTAMSRARRVGQENIVKQFGNEPGEYFQKVKNLTTQSALIREVADVGKYLHSKRSTITGLKKTREQTINNAERLGFDVDKDNYRDFVEFMRWFKSSEYSKMYDSDSEEVAEVFNSERSGATNWKKAFEAFRRGNS